VSLSVHIRGQQHQQQAYTVADTMGHRETPREKRYPIGKYPIAASVDGWWSVGQARSGRALSRAWRGTAEAGD